MTTIEDKRRESEDAERQARRREVLERGKFGDLLPSGSRIELNRDCDDGEECLIEEHLFVSGVIEIENHYAAKLSDSQREEVATAALAQNRESFAKIGKAFGISSTRVQQIRREALGQKDTPTMNDDEFETPNLSESEAASLIGVSSQTLRNFRARRFGPPFYKLGRSVLFRRSEVTEWVESCRKEPQETLESDKRRMETDNL